LGKVAHGLKELRQIGEKTVSAPNVIAPDRMSSEPRHSNRPVQIAITKPTTGESSADTRRA
jgi:hypothetical protein